MDQEVSACFFRSYTALSARNRELPLCPKHSRRHTPTHKHFTSRKQRFTAPLSLSPVRTPSRPLHHTFQSLPQIFKCLNSTTIRY